MSSSLKAVLPLLVLAALASCASSGPRPASLAELVAPALEAPEGVQFRYNPADCECPAWEFKAGSRWIRFAFPAEAEKPEAPGVQARAMELTAAGSPAVFSAPLDFSDKKVRYCPNHSPFLMMELDGPWKELAAPAAPDGKAAKGQPDGR